MTMVIDASAVLAIVFEERGHDVALSMARDSWLSAVNLDEVLHKVARRGLPVAAIEAALVRLGIVVRPFTQADARATAALHQQVHGRAISFADRACLALALASGRAVVTADGDWATLGLALDIRLIR